VRRSDGGVVDTVTAPARTYSLPSCRNRRHAVRRESQHPPPVVEGEPDGRALRPLVGGLRAPRGPGRGQRPAGAARRGPGRGGTCARCAGDREGGVPGRSEPRVHRVRGPAPPTRRCGPRTRRFARAQPPPRAGRGPGLARRQGRSDQAHRKSQPRSHGGGRSSPAHRLGPGAVHPRVPAYGQRQRDRLDRRRRAEPPAGRRASWERRTSSGCGRRSPPPPGWTRRTPSGPGGNTWALSPSAGTWSTTAASTRCGSVAQGPISRSDSRLGPGG
jgi:hypothetical protein